MATDFLNPTPSGADIHFEIPRSTHQTSGGAVTINYAPIAIWRGTLDFAPLGDDTSAANPMLSIAAADKPHAGFFVDIVEDDRVPDADPIWHTPSGSNTKSVRLNTEDAVTIVAGDIISVRQSLFPGYVTARRILKITPDRYAYLNTPLPSEYFPLARNTALQYCVNRPHVRARFAESPQRWRKAPGVMYPMSVQWVEDTARTVLTLRSVSEVAGVPNRALLTESGQVLTTEGDTPLTLE